MKNELKNYVLVGLMVLIVAFSMGCGTSTFTIEGYEGEVFFPIAKGMYGDGGSLDWLVYPMGWLMYIIAFFVVNKNYALTILLATILIRSIAWPIYGKTNDMTLKMQLLAPEQAKIQAKYANKTDKESQQRMSMEMMQLYKKYKVSFTGCLMPFIQMPIFLAFYETLRRIPFTSVNFLNTYGNVLLDKKGNAMPEVLVDSLLFNADELNTKLLGIDLMSTAGTEWNWQRWGVYIIAALVAITQIGTQLLSQHRTNKQKKEMTDTIPEYRKPAQNDQQKQTEMMMKIMLYSMPLIMVIFIINNTAALGWYWLVGNIYTAIQSLISHKLSAKKMNALREKFEENKFKIGVR